MDRDTAAIGKFFTELGFEADALKPTGANVNQYTSNGIPRYTIRQRLSLRTNDIEKTQAAVARQFDLVRRGVVLEDGSGMSTRSPNLTRLNRKWSPRRRRTPANRPNSLPMIAAPMSVGSNLPPKAISRSTHETAMAAARA